jgi:hypothetical protein
MMYLAAAFRGVKRTRGPLGAILEAELRAGFGAVVWRWRGGWPLCAINAA